MELWKMLRKAVALVVILFLCLHPVQQRHIYRPFVVWKTRLSSCTDWFILLNALKWTGWTKGWYVCFKKKTRPYMCGIDMIMQRLDADTYTSNWNNLQFLDGKQWTFSFVVPYFCWNFKIFSLFFLTTVLSTCHTNITFSHYGVPNPSWSSADRPPDLPIGVASPAF